MEPGQKWKLFPGHQDRLNQYSRTVGETKIRGRPEPRAGHGLHRRHQQAPGDQDRQLAQGVVRRVRLCGNLRPDIYLTSTRSSTTKTEIRRPRRSVRATAGCTRGTGPEEQLDRADLRPAPVRRLWIRDPLLRHRATVIDWTAIDYTEVRYEFGGADIGSASDPVDETTHVVDVTILENTSRRREALRPAGGRHLRQPPGEHRHHPGPEGLVACRLAGTRRICPPSRLPWTRAKPGARMKRKLPR